MDTTLLLHLSVEGNFQESFDQIKESTQGIQKEVEKINERAEKSNSLFKRLGDASISFDGIVRGAERLAGGMTDLIAPGIALNTSLTDLQAITGVTGDGLKQIEGYARKTAKAFGIDAAGAVESYKLILGQLSPELAKNPVALKEMGEHVATLSKLMGGDAVAAAETLNTAMNQYGVDLSDPIQASQEMARMMNVMAAAGQEGSAELPQIKEALEQAGMAAKGAGVSFEEANAAIQVLDKAGKKGSEGGVALRNVLSTLSQGRFLPKDVRKELAHAGISVTALADRSKSLKERLELLKPVMNDAALFSKLFGKENTNAAMALVGGADEVERYTEAVQGTQSASDQATVVMEGFAERQARIRQQFEDFRIEAFNALGDGAIWLSTVSESLVPIAQLTPLLTTFGTGARYAWLGASWLVGVVGKSSVWRGFLGFLRIGRERLVGLAVAAWRSVSAFVALRVKGIVSAMVSLGQYAMTLIGTAAAQGAFASLSGGIAATFSIGWQVACRAVSMAFHSIPIVGWIALAITVIGGLVAYFWSSSAKFRATLKGLWASFKTVFSSVWGMAKEVFVSIHELIVSALSFDGDGIKRAINKMSGAMSKFGAETAQAFRQAYDEEIARSEAEERAEEERKKKEKQGLANAELDTSLLQILGGDGALALQQDKPDQPQQGQGQPPRVKPTGATGITDSVTDSSTSRAGAKGGGKITHVTIQIGKLVESLTVKTANLATDPSEVKAIITETLLAAVNDANLAIQ